MQRYGVLGKVASLHLYEGFAQEGYNYFPTSGEVVKTSKANPGVYEYLGCTTKFLFIDK